MCACTLCASVCINKNWPLTLVIPSYWKKNAMVLHGFLVSSEEVVS